MAILDRVALPLRALQFPFAIVTLGLTAYLAHWYHSSTSFDSPRSNNFLIFTSLWTLLALIYLALAPRFFASSAHKFATLALDALTMIFWFAGWIALLVYKNRLLACYGHVCNVMKAAIAFAILEWLLFLATTILAALHARRAKNLESTAPNNYPNAVASQPKATEV